MDRLFLDANVLFSAAYRPESRINRIWSLVDVRLLTSDYALEEARRNLREPPQVERLNKLVDPIQVVPSIIVPLPRGVDLPEKDLPILGAAIGCRATHLITGDLRHFGALFRQTVSGVRIVSVRDYLG